MCNSKICFGNGNTHRGLHRVWLQTYENGKPRLVSIWIDPAMRVFEPCTEAQEVTLAESPVLSAGDEPPLRITADDNRLFVYAREMMRGKSRTFPFAPLRQVETRGYSFTRL